MATQQCSELILSTQELEEFFIKCKPGLPGECWERNGEPKYSKIRLGKRRLQTHRASYAAHNGSVPENMCVLHSCDNPPCWNPEHLFTGTNMDNSQDAIAKGRISRGEQHGLLTKSKIPTGDNSAWMKHPWRNNPELIPRGNQNKASVTNEQTVREIRIRRLNGEMIADLIEKYGISQTQMYRIINGEMWKHVDPPHAKFDDRKRASDNRTPQQIASSNAHSQFMINKLNKQP